MDFHLHTLPLKPPLQLLAHATNEDCHLSKWSGTHSKLLNTVLNSNIHFIAVFKDTV